MSNIQTGAERMPHDLSHLGFLAGQIGRLITDRKSGSAGMPRPISYAVFCLKKKTPGVGERDAALADGDGVQVEEDVGEHDNHAVAAVARGGVADDDLPD